MEQMVPNFFNPVYTSVPVGEDISEHEINFDRTLPGLHKYLGSDFVEVNGNTRLEPYTMTQMYAFYRSGVILVPGQNLPLIPYGPFESDLLLKVHRERKPLIFLPGCFDSFSDLNVLIGCVGTTADLLAIRVPRDDTDELEESTVHAIFVGRQRIRISKLTRDDTFPLVCHGEILPEISVDLCMSVHPLGWGLVPKSWSRFGSDQRPIPEATAQTAAVLPVAQPSRLRRITRSRSSRRSRGSNSSSMSLSSTTSLVSPAPAAAAAQSPVLVPPGDPFSIFNSRLSTWGQFGPVTLARSPGLVGNSLHVAGHPPGSSSSSSSSGILSSFGGSSTGTGVLTHTLGQFVGNSEPDSAEANGGGGGGGEPRHTSAPDLQPESGLSAIAGGRRSHSVDGPGLSLVEALELSHVPMELSTAGVQEEQKSPGGTGGDGAATALSTREEAEHMESRAVNREGRPPFRYRINHHRPGQPLLLARRDVLAATAHTFTGVPFWVFRQYDLDYLVANIQAELLTWNNTWQVGKFSPELSIPFSYWLVQNLPISGTLKAHILGINHVVQRLRSLLDIIRRSSAFICSQCGVTITSNRFLVCLAREGSFQTYVNPSGVLHDIVTVSQVSQGSVVLIGSPSEQYSWFPGYSWTITNCSNCSQHLGWLFIGLREDLQPRRFWGIRRDVIVPPGQINSPDWVPCL